MAARVVNAAANVTTTVNSTSQVSWSNTLIQISAAIGAIRDIFQSVSAIEEFQGNAVNLPPVLSAENENLFFEVFTKSREILMNSQHFLTESMLNAEAQTPVAINIQIIEELSTAVLNVLEIIDKLNQALEENLTKQQRIKFWRNVNCSAAAISAAISAIFAKTILSSTSDLTNDANVGFGVTIVVTISAIGFTCVKHCQLHVPELNKMKMKLQEIEDVLSQLSEKYPEIKSMSQNLSDENNTKKEFIEVLTDVKADVKKGFQALKKR